MHTSPLPHAPPTSFCRKTTTIHKHARNKTSGARWSNLYTSGPPHGATVPSGPRPPHYLGLTITLRHTTVGRAPLDEWSARRRDLYLTTHNTHTTATSMPQAGFELAIPASERPQTHALDRAATWTGAISGLLVFSQQILSGKNHAPHWFASCKTWRSINRNIAVLRCPLHINLHLSPNSASDNVKVASQPKMKPKIVCWQYCHNYLCFVSVFRCGDVT